MAETSERSPMRPAAHAGVGVAHQLGEPGRIATILGGEHRRHLLDPRRSGRRAKGRAGAEQEQGGELLHSSFSLKVRCRRRGRWVKPS
jgi:hypothetical protein